MQWQKIPFLLPICEAGQGCGAEDGFPFAGFGLPGKQRKALASQP
jgi:hypothetical protein